MALLAIEPAFLDLHKVDEAESEAVALYLVDFIFAETNALYRQHCLAHHAITTTATLLTTSLFDAVASANVPAEAVLDARRFHAEPSPVAEINDRHAARCLPFRSPDKPELWRLDKGTGAGNRSPTNQWKADESHHAAERAVRTSVTKRRRKPAFHVIMKTNLVTIPQVITLPEVLEEENTDAKAWRIKCLKEMNGDSSQSTSTSKLVGAMSKWTSFTRQPSAVEPRVSREIEVIDSAPPLLHQEVAAGAACLRIKSSLPTFSAITPSNHASSVRQAAASVSSRTKASLAGSQSAPVLATFEPRKATSLQLNDALSRQRTVFSGSPSPHLQHGTSSGSSVDVNPWRLDRGEDPRQAFAPDMMITSAASIPASIALSAGVGFTYGESSAKGPVRQENNHTMSRKRFELHQRLATDFLLQESRLLQPPVSPLSTHTQHPHNHSPQPYATVPPDPVPIPLLSPIAKDALVIPRNHLAQSASTPQLRVRHSSAHKRNEAAFSACLAVATSEEELEPLRKVNTRPSTALGAAIVTPPRKLGFLGHRDDGSRPKTSGGSASTTAYLREFPKPHAGTIRLNVSKTGAHALDPAADVDSASLRMAWIS